MPHTPNLQFPANFPPMPEFPPQQPMPVWAPVPLMPLATPGSPPLHAMQDWTPIPFNPDAPFNIFSTLDPGMHPYRPPGCMTPWEFGTGGFFEDFPWWAGEEDSEISELEGETWLTAPSTQELGHYSH